MRKAITFIFSHYDKSPCFNLWKETLSYVGLQKNINFKNTPRVLGWRWGETSWLRKKRCLKNSCVHSESLSSDCRNTERLCTEPLSLCENWQPEVRCLSQGHSAWAAARLRPPSTASPQPLNAFLLSPHRFKLERCLQLLYGQQSSISFPWMLLGQQRII